MSPRQPDDSPAPLNRAARRAAIAWSYLNGAVWALGNGLASTTLIIALANELGAKGIAVSLILAAPQFAGALRLFTPWLIDLAGDRRTLCIWAYAASGIVLYALPILATPGWLCDDRGALALVVSLWCLYHLLEYVATVSLYSWLGDLAPPRVRGRFLGRRETALLVGRIAGMLAAAGLAWAWQSAWPLDARWLSYALPACLGAIVMTAAALPLIGMPAAGPEAARDPAPPLARLLAPLADLTFLRFLLYGVWFSFFNGLTQAALNLFPFTLGFRGQALLGLQAGLRAGQALLAPATGAAIDAWGHRGVMIASQLVVSLGPLGYLLATRDAPWWFAAAWMLWIGYVGLNVALPSYTLALAPRGESSAYLATYQALGGVAVSLAMVGGGWLHEELERRFRAEGPWPCGSWDLNHFDVQFLAAIVLRAAGIVWLLGLVEPRGGPRSSSTGGASPPSKNETA